MLETALRQEPRNFVANLLLGIGESQLNQFSESDRHLKMATEVQPQAVEAWLYLGLNAFQQNQFAAARNWPFGSAASFILMVLVLAAVLVYLRVRDRGPVAAG